MKTKRLVIAAILAASLAGAATGQPNGNGKGKGGGDGSDSGSLDNFDPEIVYLYRKNGAYELRMTDLARSVELKMNDLGRIYGLSVSSEARKTVAFTTDTALYLQRWTTSPFNLEEPEFQFNLPSPTFLDFSRNDDKLVFVVPSSAGSRADILVYDIDNRTTETVLSGWIVTALFFSPIDDSIFFEGGQNARDGIYHFRPGVTVPTRRIRKEGNYTGENIDITKPSGLGVPLIVTDNGGDPVFFRLDGVLVGRDFPGYGFNYHFRCSNTELLYHQTQNKSGVSTAAFGGSINNLGLGWTDSRLMDWMERDPCD